MFTWLARIAVITAGVLHFMAILCTLSTNFIVVDEPYHIASGLSHWKLGNFMAYRVNPPLPRMISTFPLLAMSPVVDLDQLDRSRKLRPEWSLAEDFVSENGRRTFLLIRVARVAGLFWSLLGFLLICHWSNRLYGRSAAVIAAILWSIDPTILTFSSVVTSDMPSAVASMFASFAFWDLLCEKTLHFRRLVFSGLTLGIALLSKFTLVFLPVFWIVFLLCFRLSRHLSKAHRGVEIEDRPVVSWSLYLFKIPMVFLVAGFVVNLGYLFRGSFEKLGNYQFVSETFAGSHLQSPPGVSTGLPTNRFQRSFLRNVRIPLPKDYLVGIDLQKRDFEGAYLSYADGVWSTHGWWWYYAYALLFKEPVGILALGLLGALSVASCKSLRPVDIYIALHAVGFFLVVSSQTGFSHHLRYLLPAYPYMILIISRLGRSFNRQSLRSLTIKLLFCVCSAAILWAGIDSFTKVPHSMSYYNEIAGGPGRGHLYLMFSNTDWGQELYFLLRWMERHPEASPMSVAYTNSFDPRPFGLHAPPPPPGLSPNELALVKREPWRADSYGPKAGYFAVSATDLHRYDGKYAYFLEFEPVDRIGGAILIYHLHPDEVSRARVRMGLQDN